MPEKSRLMILFSFLIAGCSGHLPPDDLQNLIVHTGKQLELAVQNASAFRDSVLISPRTLENGELKMVPSRDWTSGFFPGELWMMYKLTGEEKWQEKALRFTLPLEQEKWNGKTHDMGFKMYCSFGKAYEITKNRKYKDILIQSAKTLTTRFNPVVGCIRSWDHNADKWQFPVIIDNMMNLELLFWAANETGNENFREIAVSHALTTMKNHFRADCSSYHVIDYDPETGHILHKQTHQGYSDESSWARGQAWGLYGFTMAYRETGMDEFLDQAEHIAGYILNQPGLTQGSIPCWDFSVPSGTDEPRDASAAAIIASALLELSMYSQKKGIYMEVSNRLINELSSPEYLASIGENHGFLLKHSTGSKPHGSEIDVPLVYADYYFIESIMRKKNSSN